MKLKNINPLGDVRPAALGTQLVKAGEVVDVPDDVAPLLVIQEANWQPVKPSKDETAIIQQALTAHAEELAEASSSAGIINHDDEPAPTPEPVSEPTPDNTDGGEQQ